MIAVLAALALVGFAGCGGDDDDAGSDPADVEASGSDAGEVGGDDSADSGGESSGEADDSSEASDSDGSADTGGSDFPIPAPDGLLLDALVDAGVDMEGQRQLYYPNEDFDRLVAFYDDWTSQNGEWSRTEALGTVVYQTLDGDLRQISITPDEDPGAQADGPATFVLLLAG